MPLSRSRDYLSIGEVLDAIREDFPDVSISKIRFLEAEGLIQPERTASGYRKFFETDVSRLRYILSLQKEHFLPLKVIRERLAAVDSNGGSYPVSTTTAVAPAPPSAGAPAPEVETQVLESGASLERVELLQASGLTDPELTSLEDFGLITTRDGRAYDENDLVIARAAKKMFAFGAEARHLRMYRQFAERETAFFSQIVAPVSRRGDEKSAAASERSMRELATLARQLHDAALRSSLRDLA